MSIDKYIDWNEIWQEEICLEIAKDCTENETHIDLIDRFLKLEGMQLLKDECSLDEDGNMMFFFSESGGQSEGDSQGRSCDFTFAFNHEFSLIDVSYSQG